MDLCERRVAVYEAKEGSDRVLAGRFSVNRAVVGELVRQARRLGTVDPLIPLRGRKRLLSSEKECELQNISINLRMQRWKNEFVHSVWIAV